MSQYSGLERRIAAVLQRFPGLKRRLKEVYQRVNYYAYADRDFEYAVADDATLSTVSDRYGAEPTDRDRFFGYFDVHPWTASMDGFLLHEVSGDAVDIRLYRDGDHTTLGTSLAWNLQQGSRTQWHPAAESVLYNDRESDRLVAREVYSDGETAATYDRPIQALHPDGTEFLSLNYDRLDRNRPDYGYGRDPRSLPDPESDGLWRVEMDSADDELLVSLQSLIDRSETTAPPEAHYLNHALYDPTGERFVFLHRWNGDEGRVSRLYVADRDGNCRVVMDDTVVSHYCWLSDSELFVWGRTAAHGDGYHVLDVDTGDTEYVGALDDYGDGHPSLSPDGRYIVTDTYPDRERKRRLLLYDRETEDVTELGRFFEPLRFTGETRCDLHPRWSPDGTAISFDSAHTGRRDSYILDVSRILS
ncbi:TolB family protein [Halorubrum tibetense]|uniref:TolB family protein n=1 Tax=Halorubrum tibetense TaxID=175631 RepID=A0ABD5S8X1_9EURY